MDLLSAADYAQVTQAINDASDSFNKDPVIWKRNVFRLSRDGDDPLEQFEDIQLYGLINNNDFRTWPITVNTESGQLDVQSQFLMLNLKHLTTLGYMNTQGYFDFDREADRFIHKGITYKPAGDTLISQVNGEYLHIGIILKREELLSGS